MIVRNAIFCFLDFFILPRCHRRACKLSPVKERLAKEICLLQVEPDTWRMGVSPLHHRVGPCYHLAPFRTDLTDLVQELEEMGI